MNQFSGWSTLEQQCCCHVGFFGDFLPGFFSGKFHGFFGSDNHVLCAYCSGSFSSFLSSARQLAASNSSGRAKPNKSAHSIECHCIRRRAVEHMFVNSSPGFAAGLSAGNIIAPSFLSTYCTLGNSSLLHPLLFDSHGALSRVLPATSQIFSPAFSTPTLAHSVTSLLHKPFVVSPGYSPISEKLVTKIKAGQFIDLQTCYPKMSRPRIPSPK